MIIDRARLDEGLALFSDGRWFEAHEVLEAAWRPLAPGPDRHFLQGLIQLAVALEHWRRGNPRGARGQWDKAQRHLDGLGDVYAGVQLARLLEDFRAYWAAVGLDAPTPNTHAACAPVPRWQP